MDSDLFRLMLDTGLLIEQSRDLSVDHKPGVNISALLRLSAAHCSRERQADNPAEQTFARRIQSMAISQQNICDSLHSLCGAGEPGPSANTALHITGTVYMAGRLLDSLPACLQRSAAHSSRGGQQRLLS